ncbi:MAG: glycerol-3-phosphate dehydrogenase [Legionella sp.]|nr:glycerol-3-phosphate dehydrogenase [Legionella sp.]
MNQIFDVAVIGGGINGCGIAADASLRGLSVVLVEKDDLASKTSSSSTKLIHGGLRYLEHYNFSLVKKSLDERQLLLNLAPHLVRPIPFVLPFEQSIRPSWFLRAGLFLYDNLSRINKLPKSKLIKRNKKSLYFPPLAEEFKKGFLFYDCTTDDARLTLTNALQAKKHGATILTETELVSTKVVDGLWHLTTRTWGGEENTLIARSIVNAAGPWVESTNQRLNIPSQYKMSLIKGSHLVVHKLYEGDHAYLLQNDDKRIVFVIPYHGYSMIGTTDVVFSGNLDDVAISSEEIDYLFELVANYFKKQLLRENIINTWSGVRPLIAAKADSPQTLSRDYTYHFTKEPAPAITIYGGKITTYRQLAEEAVNELKAVFPTLPESNTKASPLPGALWGKMNYKNYCHYAHENYYWLDESILKRLLETYGTNTEALLDGCKKISDLGLHFGNGLYQREVDYLLQEEWATTCEDILWRRTKLGLYFTAESSGQLAEYLIKNKMRGSTRKNNVNITEPRPSGSVHEI